MFDAKRAAEGCIQWTRNWFDKNGKGCVAVVGISGGKDSSVVGGICVKALGPERVIGVMMPNHTQADIQDSKDIIDFLGIKSYQFNIGGIIDKFHWQFEKDCADLTATQQADENLPPLVRLEVLRYIAKCTNGRVSKNCNASETHIGYTTVDGDNRGDFAPIRDFVVSEVIEIGRCIGMPERFLVKAPADGLCGKTDEDKLGIPYAVLDRYLRTGEIDDLEIKAKIDRMHEMNKFKDMPTAYYKYWKNK